MLAKYSAMFTEHADDFRHLRLNTREALGIGALRVASVSLDVAQVAKKRRLILNQHSHRFFKTASTVR